MKAFIRTMLILAMLLIFATSAVTADEAINEEITTDEETTAVSYTKDSENISFNYGDDSFSVTGGTGAADLTELTVMLLKGDYRETDISGVLAEDIYYLGQATGESYASLFKNLGVKIDGFDFGVYTLITGGYGVDRVDKTKLIIGSSDEQYIHSELKDKSLDFGAVMQTFRVYEEDTAETEYIYVNISKFELSDSVTPDKVGYLVQRTIDGNVSVSYRALSDFADVLGNINSISGTVQVGVQIDNVDKAADIVAIPYSDLTE